MTNYLILINEDNKIPDNFMESVELIDVVNSVGDDFKIEVIADDTVIAAELFNQLGTDVGNLKTIFIAEWKVPEDDSQ